MTRGTIIRGLKRQLLNQVPQPDRQAAAVLFAAIEDQWAAVMSATETEAYNRGVSAARQQDAEREQAGFQLGYRHGLETALAQVGAPALRVDDDHITRPAS